MAYGRGTVNKVILLGRIGQSVELKYLPNGTANAVLSVATNQSWIDKTTNEQKELTEWSRVVCWRKTAEIAAQYLKKGDQVYLEGRMQTRKWQDKNGIDRYTTEVIAENLVLIGSKSGDNNSGGPIAEPTEEFSGSAPVERPAGANGAAPAAPLDEDRLPF